MQRPALTNMPVETSRARILHYVLLAGVILVGLALRTVNIGRDPLWTDEALTLVLAQWPVWDMITKPTDPTPFFYYALHKWFVPEGAGVVGVRSISLVAGVLAMPVMYLIGRLLYRREGALVATALLAVSAPLIDYSQEARAYSVLVLLVLLSVAGLLWWSREQGGAGRRRLVAMLSFVVATALAFHTHFIAIFWVGPALVVLLLFGRRTSPRSEREALWGSAAILILVASEVSRTLQASAIGGAFDWLKQASPVDFLMVVGDSFLPAGPQIVAMAVMIWLGWQLFTTRQALRHWVASHALPAAVIAALGLSPVLIWLFGFVVRPILLPRMVLIAIPGFILAIALLIELDQSSARRRITAIAIVLLYLGALLVTGTARPKEPWGELQRTLADRVRPGDLIVVCPFWKYPAMRHAIGDGFSSSVFAPHSKVMFLLQRDGASAPWQQTHFATISEPLFRLVTTGRLSPTLTEHVISERKPARAWVISNECDAQKMQTIRRWLGGGQWSAEWSTPLDQPNYPPMELKRFDADAARDRPAIGLR